MSDQQTKGDSAPAAFDDSSDPRFISYYAEQSLSAETQRRFAVTRDKSLALMRKHGCRTERLHVADIGCGAGVQCLLWAELGHVVHGLDVNASLIELAKTRATEAGLSIQFDVGTATALPYADESIDVALLPQLLEHVPGWQMVLDEIARVLKPGGLLYLSTTNALCPKQEEFNLPGYSWYPGFLKRRYERLAVTTRPDLANYATYPAVHWFTFFALRKYLGSRGFVCFDRFDMITTDETNLPERVLVILIQSIRAARWIGHVLTPYTAVFALKQR